MHKLRLFKLKKSNRTDDDYVKTPSDKYGRV